MEKGHEHPKRAEIKHKRFEFYLTGHRGDYNACIKILNDLDLDEHGIQHLCVKEDGASTRPGNTHIKLAGLIEMKEGTDVGEMVLFFRALLTPFQHCLSLIKLRKDSQVWHAPCFEKKGGEVMNKGTPTEPDLKRLLDEKRRCRCDLRHR